MNAKLLAVIAVLAGLVLVPARTSFAKEPAKTDGRMAELKKRFEDRYPRVRELKHSGIIGETYEGYVDFVKGKSNADAKSIVDEENADRREIYKLIAEKEGTTPEQVAAQNAKLKFAKAAPGEYLRDANGEWHKKGE